MSIESDVFLRFSVNTEKLLKYGFCKKDGKFLYEKTFMNDEFKAVIEIQKTGDIAGIVYDLENNEEYLPLRYEYQEGAFVGEVREAYVEILSDIKKFCCVQNYFISEQTNRIAGLIKEKYGDNPLFLWDDSPSAGVFKNPQSGKWYGIVMYISRIKLGEPSEEMVEVMNLKLDTDEIEELRKKDGFYPAYHMNKKYWITITLDETLSDDEIMGYIEESHIYTVKKSKQKKC